MNFWKDHEKLRLIIIAAFFIIGMVLVFAGWKMTGKMAGLGLMIVGLILLLAALLVYNKRYE